MQNSEAPKRAVSSAAREDLVGVEERRRQDLGLELRRLTAEVAVLGASAGLGREDALHFDLGAAPRQTDLVGHAASEGTALAGRAARARQLVEGQLFAAVEERVTGFGDHRTGVGCEHRRRLDAARSGPEIDLRPPSHWSAHASISLLTTGTIIGRRLVCSLTNLPAARRTLRCNVSMSTPP